MDLKELESKHLKVWVDHSDIPSESSKQNTKVSIEFAISVLEDFIYNKRHLTVFHMTEDIMGKIKELKQYLDEKV